jgi:hypothetical protein
MVYEQVWKVLEEIVIELRKKGVITPLNVMNDLKSAKVLMNVLNVSERDHGETGEKIRHFLGSVEAYLITKAQETFPQSRIDTWLRRIEETNYDIGQTSSVKNEKKLEVESKFVTGVPRNLKWIRIKPLAELPAENLKKLAKNTSLSFREERDGQVILYGNAEDIKELIKKISEQTGK